MAGRPTVNDDDLLIELEDAPDDFAPSNEPEKIADYAPEQVLAPTVPDGEEGEEILDAGEELSRAPAARTREVAVAEPVDDGRYEQISAAEERARNAEAHAIWVEAQSQASVLTQQRDSIKVGQDALRLRIDAAEAALDQADEAGDRRAKNEIERDLRTMRELQRELETAGTQLADPQAIIEAGRQKAIQHRDAPAAGKKVGAGIQARHPLAEKWSQSNPWMRVNREANDSVIRFSNAMTREGFNPNTPGFYAELSRRVQAAHPSIKVASIQAPARQPGKNQARSPVAPTRSSAASATRQSGAAKSKYVISAGEQSKMRQYRLDPENKAHQQAWAKVRIKSSARAQQRGA